MQIHKPVFISTCEELEVLTSSKKQVKAEHISWIHKVRVPKENHCPQDWRNKQMLSVLTYHLRTQQAETMDQASAGIGKPER